MPKTIGMLLNARYQLEAELGRGDMGRVYRLLTERAAEIEDEGLRRSFLENVPAHRDLIDKFQSTGPSG